ncbi:hypothetical protein GCM10010156_76170 [Planobispora rosea]|uniref:Uncharacterized protein n=1 Tax=Planobispora rosea TaxID=35762 RepID=A0A8J3S990_PLARO|nr:hypothetical protein GCM10010156_76170 [Planobispora rosea]GIH89159.1 hypothetical protein Pro02_75670 [Planobispora rosea]
MSFIVTTTLSVIGLYFTWRADRRAERGGSGPAAIQARTPTVQPPRQATAYPPPETRGHGVSGRGTPPQAGGGAWIAAWAGVVLTGTTAIYMIPDHMVHSFPSRQEFGDAYQASVIMTAIAAFGLAVSAWVRGRTDWRTQRRITRRIVYVHALVALAGLTVCVVATVTNLQYMQ